MALYSKLQEFNEIGAKAQDYARENVSDAEFQGEHAKDIEKGFVLFSEANVKFLDVLGTKATRYTAPMVGREYGERLTGVRDGANVSVP